MTQSCEKAINLLLITTQAKHIVTPIHFSYRKD